ncbi:transposase [Enterococcus faecium]|nr:transposase [Enterococcus faecium]
MPSTDMNATYFQLKKCVLPNVKLVIDRFYFYTHISN